MQNLLKWAFDNEKESVQYILKEVPLFKNLNKKLLRKLIIDLIEKDYEPGDTIFAEGDIGKALYIIIEGSITIVKTSASQEKVLARLGPGSYFGELALINQSPRFATAVAETRTSLLIMYKSYFDDLIENNSVLSSRILLNLAKSLSSYICRSRENEEKLQGFQTSVNFTKE